MVTDIFNPSGQFHFCTDIPFTYLIHCFAAIYVWHFPSSFLLCSLLECVQKRTVWSRLSQRTKRTSPPRNPYLPQSLRDLLRFARRCAAAKAAFLCTSCASRGAFCCIGNKVSYTTKKLLILKFLSGRTVYIRGTTWLTVIITVTFMTCCFNVQLTAPLLIQDFQFAADRVLFLQIHFAGISPPPALWER